MADHAPPECNSAHDYNQILNLLTLDDQSLLLLQRALTPPISFPPNAWCIRSLYWNLEIKIGDQLQFDASKSNGTNDVAPIGAVYMTADQCLPERDDTWTPSAPDCSCKKTADGGRVRADPRQTYSMPVYCIEYTLRNVYNTRVASDKVVTAVRALARVLLTHSRRLLVCPSHRSSLSLRPHKVPCTHLMPHVWFNQFNCGPLSNKLTRTGVQRGQYAVNHAVYTLPPVVIN